jgi:Thioredoxin like C-terminal domain/AhpC/TSA family
MARISRLPTEGRFPSLAGATEWLHSPALDPAGLRGKVVLIDFCTYTCINWLRTLAYIRAWAQWYRDHGLAVIGVHTPEFSFEHDLEKVRRALASLNVDYPIAVDNDYAVWEAFANHYWPALYFIDAEGNIRHHWFGEGDYERSEAVIQELLRDAGADDIGAELVAIDPVGPEVEADWDNLGSPETYLGTERTRNFASRDRLSRGEARTYEAPDSLRVNDWALSGDWTAEAESVFSNEPNGRVAFRFHARDVNLVMGPRKAGSPVAFRVSIDGEPPRTSFGSDADGEGAGLLDQQRMYQLVRQQGPVVDRTFEIEFLDRGAEAFAFTFG